jgi:hypothetical protein
VTGNTIVFTSGGINLLVVLDMNQMYNVSTNTGALTHSSSRIEIDTNDYDGDTVVYNWELNVVNRNSNNISYSINLINGAGTVVATQTIPRTGGTESHSRFTTTFTPTIGTDFYRLGIPQTEVNSDIIVGSSRIIIKQVKAKKTRIYVPFMSRNAFSASNGANSIVTTTQTDYSLANQNASHIWVKDLSRYKDFSTAADAFTFEAVLYNNNASGVSNMVLFNRTTGQPVTASEVSASGTANTQRYRSVSFAANATDFTNSHEFDVRLITNNSSYTAAVSKVGMYIRLQNLTKLETHWRMFWRITSTETQSMFCGGRVLFTTADWSNPAVYSEHRGVVSSTENTWYTSFFDVGQNDASQAGAYILPYNLLFLTRDLYREGPYSLTNNNRYCTGIARSTFVVGNTIDSNGSFMIISAEQ